MYKDSKRTCIAIVLLIKPFVWRRSRRRRHRGLLKLPNICAIQIMSATGAGTFTSVSKKILISTIGRTSKNSTERV